jgi:hypothetical protein
MSTRPLFAALSIVALVPACASVVVEGGAPTAHAADPIVIADAAGDGSHVGGQCLSEPPPLDGDQARCVVLYVRDSQGVCSCPEGSAFPEVRREHAGAVAVAEQVGGAWDCACELPQLEGADAEACRTQSSNPVEVDGRAVHGFCYVDPSVGLGANDLTATCPADQQRRLRFLVEDGAMEDGSALVIVCDRGA